jgi:hypothetical protein
MILWKKRCFLRFFVNKYRNLPVYVAVFGSLALSKWEVEAYAMAGAPPALLMVV